MTDMAVAVVNWNTRDLLRTCLRSVFADAPGEVVVVDNCSSDGSIEMVRREFPSAILEVLPANLGYGAGANAGIRRSATRHILLLNSDTVLRPGALSALSTYLDQHEHAGIVGPRLLNPDGTLQTSCFAFPSPLLVVFRRQPFAWAARLVPLLRDTYPGRWAHYNERRVPWVLGAALAMKRAAFESVGGFDESFVMYYEEVDLCYRLRQRGWETHFAPVTEVTHVGGASTRQRRTEMLLRFNLSLIDFHRRHHQGVVLALALGIVRANAAARLLRNTVRYHLSAAGPARERIAEDLTAWREVLARSHAT